MFISSKDGLFKKFIAITIAIHFFRKCSLAQIDNTELGFSYQSTFLFGLFFMFEMRDVDQMFAAILISDQFNSWSIIN
jgi:hypothetical protein